MSIRIKYKFSDLVNIIGGGTPKTCISEYWGGEIPWLSVVDFSGDIKMVYSTEKSITEKGLKESSTKLLKKGQLIISARGTIGELAMLGKDMAFNQSCYGLDAKPELAINNFVYYLLKYKIESLKAVSHGSIFDTITRQTFDQIEVTIPDLPTQSRIAEILSALDDKIELNRRMNQTLEQMAQTLFEKYSEVDELVHLTELIELNPKITLKKGTESQYVEMSNLSETSASIKQSVLRNYSGGSKFQNNDTLLARITPCLENGKTGFVDILDCNEVGFGSTEYIVMRAKQKISPYFVYCVARDKAFREYAIKSMTGTSGRQRVQVDMLETFALPKWKSESMETFHRSAKAAFQKIKANSKEIKILTNLRDTLLPKLMSGEIDVMQTQPAGHYEEVLS